MKALKILLDERKQQLDIFEQNKELGNPNESNYIVLLNEELFNKRTNLSRLNEEHKSILSESLVNFDEGKRIRKIMLEIDSNLADYEYYFQSGQQSKQDEIDRIVGIVTEAYKSGGNSSVETIYDKIQELLK